MICDDVYIIWSLPKFHLLWDNFHSGFLVSWNTGCREYNVIFGLIL